jgi:hypothetical protein
MDETYPGDVVVIQDPQRGVENIFIAVSVDRQLGLFLRILEEEPFHPWHIKLQEEWQKGDLYVEMNILHQPGHFMITARLGSLTAASRRDIVDAADRSDALLDEQKEIIQKRMLDGADFSYFAKGEAPDDIPWD